MAIYGGEEMIVFWIMSVIIWTTVFVYVIFGSELGRFFNGFMLRREMVNRCPTCNIKTFQAKDCVTCRQAAGLQ